MIWIQNYLSNRTQRVVINNVSSDWSNVKAGVPQGSILGPLFFIKFINVIITNMQSQIKLFSDNTSLYLILDEPQHSAKILNSDLDKILTWFSHVSNWLLSFNPQKSETMTISRRVDKPHHPHLYMNNSIITEVQNCKHLGLTISNDGIYHNHINVITEKAYRQLDIVRKFKFILDKKLWKLYI